MFDTFLTHQLSTLCTSLYPKPCGRLVSLRPRSQLLWPGAFLRLKRNSAADPLFGARRSEQPGGWGSKPGRQRGGHYRRCHGSSGSPQGILIRWLDSVWSMTMSTGPSGEGDRSWVDNWVDRRHRFLMGFSLINQPFWGTPILGNLHVNPFWHLELRKTYPEFRLGIDHASLHWVDHPNWFRLISSFTLTTGL